MIKAHDSKCHVIDSPFGVLFDFDWNITKLEVFNTSPHENRQREALSHAFHPVFIILLHT